ncbi:MAG: nicotinate-nucleotide diphosphorylase [Planctomycetaceae bacterium]|jgi:nicotinate-nucleotide pyrophosphorylase (carboxylating)|nr:nicotinate-nucleotide diphosphorylase [Planctomycetaceae bacterium]
MFRDFYQNNWSSEIENELQQLLKIAVAEDAGHTGDLTSLALIPEQLYGSATIRSRENGVMAGVQAVPAILKAINPALEWQPNITDGSLILSGDKIGLLKGSVQSILIAERLVLNLLGKLSGIATLTKKYVEAVAGTPAKIYDTRKTTLGWRRLEKYAVRCGGGRNHRTGLFDAVLIKDNHLAVGHIGHNSSKHNNRNNSGQFTPAEAVVQTREFFRLHSDSFHFESFHESFHKNENQSAPFIPIIEIEVDTLEQLQEVLPVKPDIVLLDNMALPQLIQAVEIRNNLAPEVELEASGGINLKTVGNIATTGVERISVGALTHSAIALDLGLDWD